MVVSSFVKSTKNYSSRVDEELFLVPDNRGNILTNLSFEGYRTSNLDTSLIGLAIKITKNILTEKFKKFTIPRSLWSRMKKDFYKIYFKYLTHYSARNNSYVPRNALTEALYKISGSYYNPEGSLTPYKAFSHSEKDLYFYSKERWLKNNNRNVLDFEKARMIGSFVFKVDFELIKNSLLYKLEKGETSWKGMTEKRYRSIMIRLDEGFKQGLITKEEKEKAVAILKKNRQYGVYSTRRRYLLWAVTEWVDKYFSTYTRLIGEYITSLYGHFKRRIILQLTIGVKGVFTEQQKRYKNQNFYGYTYFGLNKMIQSYTRDAMRYVKEIINLQKEQKISKEVAKKTTEKISKKITKKVNQKITKKVKKKVKKKTYKKRSSLSSTKRRNIRKTTPSYRRTGLKRTRSQTTHRRIVYRKNNSSRKSKLKIRRR